MKKFFAYLFSLSLCGSAFPMATNPLDLVNNQYLHDLEIVDLPVDRWAEFEKLQKQASNSLVLGELSTQPIKDNKPEDYQRLLKVAQRETVCWMVFAQQNKKLVGMAGAIAAKKRKPLISGGATILTDYTTNEIEGMQSHRKMVSALLDKLTNARIAHAEVRIPLCESNTIEFYKDLGFSPLFTTDFDVCMQKILNTEE